MSYSSEIERNHPLLENIQFVRIEMKMTRSEIHGNFKPTSQNNPVEWVIEDSPVEYEHALHEMNNRVASIISGEAPELVWLLEHPPVYTAGTSAKPQDLKSKNRFPVHKTGRGGQFTYHGPGQRVAYVMLDLKRRQPDVRAFVSVLEEWIIQTLKFYNIKGERREDRVGVWVKRIEKGEKMEEKIAAIGIRLKKWVSFHGISLNVDPDLQHYSGIIPCGVEEHGVTSFLDLGYPTTMPEIDCILRSEFEKLFGPTVQRNTSNS